MHLSARAIAFRYICFEIIVETKSLVHIAEVKNVAREDQKARG